MKNFRIYLTQKVFYAMDVAAIALDEARAEALEIFNNKNTSIDNLELVFDSEAVKVLTEEPTPNITIPRALFLRLADMTEEAIEMRRISEDPEDHECVPFFVEDLNKARAILGQPLYALDTAGEEKDSGNVS